MPEVSVIFGNCMVLWRIPRRIHLCFLYTSYAVQTEPYSNPIAPPEHDIGAAAAQNKLVCEIVFFFQAVEEVFWHICHNSKCNVMVVYVRPPDLLGFDGSGLVRSEVQSMWHIWSSNTWLKWLPEAWPHRKDSLIALWCVHCSCVLGLEVKEQFFCDPDGRPKKKYASGKNLVGLAWQVLL